MKRSLILLSAVLWTIPTSLLLASARACDVLRKSVYVTPPELTTFNELRRLDLLAGSMPLLPAPTEQVTRPRDDQRPWLQRFVLPRNDFAF